MSPFWKRCLARFTPAIAGLMVSVYGTAAESNPGTWCRTSAPAFELVSDLPAREQEALLRLLARFEPVAAPFLPGQPVKQPSTLKIVIFSRRGEFRRLTGKRRFAGFMQPSLQTNRLLIGPLRSNLEETLLHEYAHYLLRNRINLSLPVWFDEGLASLLGRMAFQEETAYVGKLPAGRLRQRARGDDGERPADGLRRTLDAVDLEGWTPQRIDAFYAWSLLLVHYLYLERLGGQPVSGTDLDRFLADGEVALTAHLGTSVRGLRRTLDRYLQRPAPPVRAHSPPPGPLGLSHTCLSDFQRDHELARAVLAQNPEGALKLLAPHLEVQGANADLLVTRARIQLALNDPGASASLLEDALALAPGHAEALVLQADLLIQDCLFRPDGFCRDRWEAARRLYRDGLRQDPGRIDGVLGLGLANLYTGRPGDAVNYLKVAYSRAPWAPVVNYYLGESYRLVGDSRARAYLTNARNWARLPVWRLLAEASLERLQAPARD